VERRRKSILMRELKKGESENCGGGRANSMPSGESKQLKKGSGSGKRQAGKHPVRQRTLEKEEG